MYTHYILSCASILLKNITNSTAFTLLTVYCGPIGDASIAATIHKRLYFRPLMRDDAKNSASQLTHRCLVA